MHELLLIIECSHHHKYKAGAAATWNIEHFSCGLTEPGPDTRLADNNVAQPHALVVCVNYIVARRAKGGRIIGVIIPPSSALQNYLHLLLYHLVPETCMHLFHKIPNSSNNNNNNFHTYSSSRHLRRSQVRENRSQCVETDGRKEANSVFAVFMNKK